MMIDDRLSSTILSITFLAITLISVEDVPIAKTHEPGINEGFPYLQANPSIELLLLLQRGMIHHGWLNRLA